MSNVTRSKFYVSGVSINANSVSEQEYDPENIVQTGAQITMTPVYSSRPDAENHAFWSATPGGKLSMSFWGKEHYEQYRPGTFWYVDLIEDPEGTLVVKTRETSGNDDPASSEWGCMAVVLKDNTGNGLGGTTLELSVSNKRAWRGFEVGARYRLELTLAPKLGYGIWYEGKRVALPAQKATGGYLRALLGISEDRKMILNGNRGRPVADDQEVLGYDYTLTLE